jgi:hypothetical protein
MIGRRSQSPESLPLFYKCVTLTWDLSRDTDLPIYEHNFTDDSYHLSKMPAAELAQIKNFKLYWTGVSYGARGLTNRAVNFSLEISQVNNVKKMESVFYKRGESESQELKKAMDSVLREIGYWGIIWKLQQHHLITFQDAVNKILRENMFGQ